MAIDLASKPQAEIALFQQQKFKETLQYVAANSPFYKRVFAGKNIDVALVKTMADFQKLPCTTQEDLQQKNDAFFCVPKSEVIDYVTTAGTMGDPIMVGLTEKDLQRLTYNGAVSLACSGVTAKDTVQLVSTLDNRCLAGITYYYGLRELGASVVRVGPGLPELQWDSILKFKPKYLICEPSFLLKLIAYAKVHNIKISDTSVKNVVCIDEPIRDANFQLNALGKKITNLWDVKLFAAYTATEIQTVFHECKIERGGHLHAELMVAEILDEENEPVPYGQIGELVITTLGVEGMPLIRYKTGDMMQLHTQQCECGRNTIRLGPVVGRKKEKIQYKDKTLYPPAMYNVLQDFEQLQSFVIEIFKNKLGVDEILLKVVSDDLSEAFKDTLKDRFRAKLSVCPNIEFTTQDRIDALQYPKMSRKPVLFIDNRNQS